MLVVALVIASLVASVRAQTRVAGARERRTALLYAMSRELAATRQRDNIARVAVKHVAETFSGHAVVLLPDSAGRLHHPARYTTARKPARRRPVGGAVGLRSRPARWPRHGHAAGRGGAVPAAARRQPHAGRPCGSSRRSDAGCCCPNSSTCWRPLPDRSAWPSSAPAWPRRQRPRSSPRRPRACATRLLASISHDLRTPLAVIAGAGSALGDPAARH